MKSREAEAKQRNCKEGKGKVSISYLFSLFLNKMGNRRVGFAISRFIIFRSFIFKFSCFILFSFQVKIGQYQDV